MNGERQGKGEDRYPQEHPASFDDGYVFDGSTGIYKPKSYESHTQVSNEVDRKGKKRSFRVSVDPTFVDVLPIIISVVGVSVSLITVILLIATVKYTYMQWQEANRSATAAETSAAAAKSAAETAAKTLVNSQRPFRSISALMSFSLPRAL